MLEWSDTLPDGSTRVLASKILEGTPKGPFRFEGTRDDDPNGYYPHEDRRELRGLWVLAAWTGYVDLRFMNTLDVWIDPPGYLKHYILDFGASLGSGSTRITNPREGREYVFDLWPALGQWVTLGAYRVGWEGREAELIHPSLGWIPTESFEPGAWKPNIPNDAYRKMTARDGYWGAKLVGAFEREHLEAAVEEGRYAGDVPTDTLVDILVHRQRKVLRHFYGLVTPVERVEVDEREGSMAPADRVDPRENGEGRRPPMSSTAPDTLWVYFDDLGVVEEFWMAEETRYAWRLEGLGVRKRREGVVEARSGGRQMLRVLVPSAGADGGAATGEDLSERMLRLELTARCGPKSRRPAVVTLVHDRSGYRVAGLTH